MNNINKSLDEISAQRKNRNRGFGNRRFRRNNNNYRRNNTNYNRNQRNNFNNNQRRNTNNQINRRRNFQRDNRRRLYITNLNKRITNDELIKIFKKYGKLRRCGVNFTQLGQSKGTADVEFERHRDAVFAIRKLNGADIDGKMVYVRFSNLRSIGRIGRRIRLGNRNRNLIPRRRIRNNNNNGIRKRRIFKRSLGRRRRIWKCFLGFCYLFLKFKFYVDFFFFKFFFKIFFFFFNGGIDYNILYF